MYNIKMVSKMLNIPAVTIRAWERRYQVLTPKRTEAGHRLYTDNDIEDLRWLKKQTEELGLNISQAVQLLQKKKEEGQYFSEQDERTHKGFQEHVDHLYDTVVDLDSAKSNMLLDLYFSMFSFDEVFQSILVPVLKKVGDQWEQGKISVAQEHFASQLFSQRIHQFLRVFPVNPSLPRVLSFCPSGEHHQIGLLLFSLFLRKKGLDVTFLGPDTPYEGVEELVEKKAISIIAISLTNADLLEQTINFIRTFSERFTYLKFVAGGQAFLDDKESFVWIIGEDQESWQQWFSAEIN